MSNWNRYRCAPCIVYTIGLILESEVTVIIDQYQCVKTDCKYLRSKKEILSSLGRVYIACILYIHTYFFYT